MEGVVLLSFFMYSLIYFKFLPILGLFFVQFEIYHVSIYLFIDKRKHKKIDVVAAFSKASAFSPEIRARLVRLSLWKNESFLV